jgi:hypothetical protein
LAPAFAKPFVEMDFYLQLATLNQKQILATMTQFKGICKNELGKYSDPTSEKRAPITLAKAIPSRWKDDFPLVFQVPLEALTNDVLFTGVSAASDAEVQSLLTRRKRRRQSEQESCKSV